MDKYITISLNLYDLDIKTKPFEFFKSFNIECFGYAVHHVCDTVVFKIKEEDYGKLPKEYFKEHAGSLTL